MYMGIENFEAIVRRLLDADMPATLKVSIVSKVSLQDQKLITGTLETIVGIVREQGVEAPAVFFIGEHTVPVSEEFAGSMTCERVSRPGETGENIYTRTGDEGKKRKRVLKNV